MRDITQEEYWILKELYSNGLNKRPPSDEEIASKLGMTAEHVKNFRKEVELDEAKEIDKIIHPRRYI